MVTNPPKMEGKGKRKHKPSKDSTTTTPSTASKKPTKKKTAAAFITESPDPEAEGPFQYSDHMDSAPESAPFNAEFKLFSDFTWVFIAPLALTILWNLNFNLKFSNYLVLA